MSATSENPAQKISTQHILGRKGGEKLVVVTCYDYTFARLVDTSADVVLVGDSLGMVIQGEQNTLGVTVDEMVYHCRSVSRGIRRAHLVADMPFLSYQTGVRDALRNAGKLLARGKAEAVKLEGGVEVAPLVEKLVATGIPVMGHVGLTPQRVHVFGGFRVQGKTESARQAILQDALALEDAGAYSLVLEGIPSDLAADVTSRVKIPTIGIGAGPDCDGQVLVLQDLLGLNVDFQPRFVRHFDELGARTREAIGAFASEVRQGNFPGPEHGY